MKKTTRLERFRVSLSFLPLFRDHTLPSSFHPPPTVSAEAVAQLVHGSQLSQSRSLAESTCREKRRGGEPNHREAKKRLWGREGEGEVGVGVRGVREEQKTSWGAWGSSRKPF